MEENIKPTIRERFADVVDISKDIILDTALIKFIGNRELTIENYKGIIEYTDTCIRVKAKPNILKITGKNLEIKTITQEMLYITGRILCFSFEY
ncbi:MAG: YabP/YqfC family sporulation protein [Oscillospiraceae bacterium]